MSDRDEGDALFAAAWEWGVVEPLADWLADRLPRPGEYPVQLMVWLPPRGEGLYLHLLPGVANNSLFVGDYDDLFASTIRVGVTCRPNNFAAPAADHIRQRLAEIRRARAAADAP